MSKRNTTRIRITGTTLTENDLAIRCAKLWLLRTARKVGDEEVVNNTVLGKLNMNSKVVQYEKVVERDLYLLDKDEILAILQKALGTRAEFMMFELSKEKLDIEFSAYGFRENHVKITNTGKVEVNLCADLLSKGNEVINLIKEYVK